MNFRATETINFKDYFMVYLLESSQLTYLILGYFSMLIMMFRSNWMMKRMDYFNYLTSIMEDFLDLAVKIVAIPNFLRLMLMVMKRGFNF